MRYRYLIESLPPSNTEKGEEIRRQLLNYRDRVIVALNSSTNADKAYSLAEMRDLADQQIVSLALS